MRYDDGVTCSAHETEIIPKLNDDVKPEVSITEPDHNVTDSAIDYDKDGMTLTITASDANSGLKSATYTVTKDGVVGEPVEIEIVNGVANATYTLDENGEYVIKVTATDNAGLTADVTSDTLVIDTVKPVVKYEYSTDYNTITVTVEDEYLDTVTVGETTYEVVDGRCEFTLTKPKDETVTYVIVATDKADNETIVEVDSDGTKPTVEVTTDPMLNIDGEDDKAYSNEDVEIIIKATDDPIGSGILETKYRVYTKAEDGKFVEGEKTIYSDKKLVLTENGEYYVVAWTYDNHKNQSDKVQTGIIVIDKTAPDATITPDAGVKTPTNTAVNVTVDATDDLSGVKKVEYVVSAYPDLDTDAIESWTELDGDTVTVKAEGDNYVYVKVTDKAGNVTVKRSERIVIDYTAPGTKVTATDSEGIKIDYTDSYISEPETVYTNKDVALDIVPELESDKTGYIIYPYEGKIVPVEDLAQIDADKWTDPDEKAPVITEEGKYIVYVKTTDEAGNTTYVNTNVIVIDKTKPVISEDLKALYCATESVTFYATDDNKVVTVEIDGVKVEADANGGYTVYGNNGTIQTIKVTDLASNVTEFEITVYASHTPGEAVIENNVKPTCTVNGSYDVVTYCTVCGEETSRDTVVVLATGHTAGDKVVENNIKPTCTAAGSYEEVVYCTV
ncbi:MAG: Ig-like domain repeat protein, partial [Clostridia bacterium]|nr:Ig-like domain repeat protein [Clostridia bacterium]